MSEHATAITARALDSGAAVSIVTRARALSLADQTALQSIAQETALQRDSDADGQLVSQWLHGRSEHTQRAYKADIGRFLLFVGKPLRAVTLSDVQAFDDSIGSPGAKSRALSAVKSLLAFGHRVGYLPFDVGRVVKLPKQKNTLAERILDERAVHRMIDREPKARNRVLLQLLYVAGLRCSEIAGLRWRDLTPREGAGQVNVFGKGSKTRVVLLPASTWRDVDSLRNGADHDAPVFVSRQGGRLDTSVIYRLVRDAADRAGCQTKVSPHWLRHSHATHALERGAPIHIVQATLGHASVSTTGRYLHARPTDSSARYLA